MDDPASHEPPAHQGGTGPNDGERARALAEIARDYPGWEAWKGVLAGVVYARRSRTSPPLVVRAVTTTKLRQAIEAAEREGGLRQ
jgi:hypothetical protein